MDWAKTITRQDEKLLNLGFGVAYYWRFDSGFFGIFSCLLKEGLTTSKENPGLDQQAFMFFNTLYKVMQGERHLEVVNCKLRAMIIDLWYTVECRYNAVQYNMILLTTVHLLK